MATIGQGPNASHALEINANEAQSNQSNQSSQLNQSNESTLMGKSLMAAIGKKKLDLYRWQVAGHLPIFYFDGYLYKPSPEVEIKFYKEIPNICHGIRDFIPKFYGVEHISSMDFGFDDQSNQNQNHQNHQNHHQNHHQTGQKSDTNNSTQLAVTSQGTDYTNNSSLNTSRSPNNSNGPKSTSSTTTPLASGPHRNNPRHPTNPNNNSQPTTKSTNSTNSTKAAEMVGSKENKQGTQSGADGSKSKQKQANPWSFLCFEKSSTKLKNMSFIALENIVHPFKKPFILDLKLGIRQFPPICDIYKKRRKMRKAYYSTCRDFGVRIGGMQIWNQERREFQQIDKNAGMTMNCNQFVEAVESFFSQFPELDASYSTSSSTLDPSHPHSSQAFAHVSRHPKGRLRVKVIEKLISGLKDLIDFLAHEHRFRFFSSSLLIVYEGQKLSSYMSGSMTPPHAMGLHRARGRGRGRAQNMSLHDRDLHVTDRGYLSESDYIHRNLKKMQKAREEKNLTLTLDSNSSEPTVLSQGSQSTQNTQYIENIEESLKNAAKVDPSRRKDKYSKLDYMPRDLTSSKSVTLTSKLINGTKPPQGTVLSTGDSHGSIPSSTLSNHSISVATSRSPSISDERRIPRNERNERNERMERKDANASANASGNAKDSHVSRAPSLTHLKKLRGTRDDSRIHRSGHAPTAMTSGHAHDSHRHRHHSGLRQNSLDRATHARPPKSKNDASAKQRARKGPKGAKTQEMPNDVQNVQNIQKIQNTQKTQKKKENIQETQDMPDAQRMQRTQSSTTGQVSSRAAGVSGASGASLRTRGRSEHTKASEKLLESSSTNGSANSVENGEKNGKKGRKGKSGKRRNKSTGAGMDSGSGSASDGSDATAQSTETNDSTNDSNDSNSSDGTDIAQMLDFDTGPHNSWTNFEPDRCDMRLIDFSNFVKISDYYEHSVEDGKPLDRKKRKFRDYTVMPDKPDKDMKNGKMEPKRLQLKEEFDNLDMPDYGLLYGLETFLALLEELLAKNKIERRDMKQWRVFRNGMKYSKSALMPFDEFDFESDDVASNVSLNAAADKRDKKEKKERKEKTHEKVLKKSDKNTKNVAETKENGGL